MKDTTKLRRDKKIADHNKPATEEPTSRQKRRQEDSSIQMPVATGAMLSAILAARPGRLEIVMLSSRFLGLSAVRIVSKVTYFVLNLWERSIWYAPKCDVIDVSLRILGYGLTLKFTI